MLTVHFAPVLLAATAAGMNFNYKARVQGRRVCMPLAGSCTSLCALLVGAVQLLVNSWGLWCDVTSPLWIPIHFVLASTITNGQCAGCAVLQMLNLGGLLYGGS